MVLDGRFVALAFFGILYPARSLNVAIRVDGVVLVFFVLGVCVELVDFRPCLAGTQWPNLGGSFHSIYWQNPS